VLALLVDAARWHRPGSAPRVACTWTDDQGRTFATGFIDGDARWIEWPGLGVFRFERRSPTVRFHPDPGVEADAVRSFFERVVQPVILQAQGHVVLHGSAVAGPGGAVILCGTSGSGKSTLAYALGTASRFTQLADDAVLVLPDEPGRFVVRALPFRPRLRPPAAAHLSGSTRPSAPEQERPAASPLRAIVVLEQDRAGGLSTGVPGRVAPASAFSVLLPHAHAFDTEDRTETERLVRQFLALAEAVPVYRLTYRPDFSTLPLLTARVAALVEPEAPADGAVRP